MRPNDVNTMSMVLELSDRQLLGLYAAVMGEMRSRRLVRSSNGPGADYAEGLAAKAFALTLNGASTAGYDGIDSNGRRFEVKCRRLTSHNTSRQLSAIRGLEKKQFDSLLGILFDENFKVLRAALIPYDVVKANSRFVKQTNSWKFMLKDSVWSLPGVEEVTKTLQSAQQWD